LNVILVESRVVSSVGLFRVGGSEHRSSVSVSRRIVTGIASVSGCASLLHLYLAKSRRSSVLDERKKKPRAFTLPPLTTSSRSRGCEPRRRRTAPTSLRCQRYVLSHLLKSDSHKGPPSLAPAMKRYQSHTDEAQGHHERIKSLRMDVNPMQTQFFNH
jgi:hypothetical protein